MQTYSRYAPTQFDTRGLALDNQQDWLVAPVGINRDSGALDKANWDEQFALLGGESDDVELHRFGHWACGWYEIVIVRPDTAAATKAADIEERLADYPCLSEDRWSRYENEEASEWWAAMSLRERAEMCARAGVSIFAARSEEIPGEDRDPSGRLYDLLTLA